jgi:hypothetical protein
VIEPFCWWGNTGISCEIGGKPLEEKIKMNRKSWARERSATAHLAPRQRKEARANGQAQLPVPETEPAKNASLRSAELKRKQDGCREAVEKHP